MRNLSLGFFESYLAEVPDAANAEQSPQGNCDIS